MKKIVNNPNDFAREVIEGLALAYPQYIRQLPGFQVILRKDAPVAGKVTILTGGGSGHEPMFAGYVGRGMADASVAGNVFASPPPPPIYEAAKAAHGGAGVLFLYGNYSGDDDGNYSNDDGDDSGDDGSDDSGDDSGDRYKPHKHHVAQTPSHSVVIAP